MIPLKAGGLEQEQGRARDCSSVYINQLDRAALMAVTNMEREQVKEHRRQNKHLKRIARWPVTYLMACL